MDIEYLGDLEDNVKIIMTRREARAIKHLVAHHLDLYFSLRGDISLDEFEGLREDLKDFII